jgi:hypothetical protein
VHRTVAAAARAAIARVLLVVTIPWVDTVGAVSPPLVRSCGGDGAADVQKPDVMELSMEELCVEEPIHFRRGLAGSSEEFKRESHW